MSSRSPVTVAEVDALLPQTQCGLCGYGGCMPYAKAIAEDGEAINRCPPGGLLVLNKLAQLLEQEPIPFVTPPKPRQRAFIREDECIGCMKCIQACPVDAIVGAAKLMHTVIEDACTGCELCISPCPVDCIDLLPVEGSLNEFEFYQKADKARQAFYRRNKRLEPISTLAAEKQHATLNVDEQKISERKNFVAEAIARAKAKKEGFQ